MAPILLDGDKVPEMSAAGTLVGNLSVDKPGTYTFTVLDDAGGRYKIPAGSNQLQVKSGITLLNRETRIHTYVKIRATEIGGDVLERTFTVEVTDVNEAPTSISISSASVPENSPYGTAAGRLSVSPPRRSLTCWRAQ